MLKKKKNTLEDVFPDDHFWLGLAYAIALAMAVLHLSLLNLVITVTIDTLYFFLFFPITNWVFYRVYPQFRFVKNPEEAMQRVSSSPEKQQELFTLLSQYPSKRAIFIAFAGIFKVFPAAAYAAYRSDATPTFLGNLELFYVVDVFNLIYISGLLFIQLHHFTSDFMSDVLKRDGWGENYKNLRLEIKNDHLSFSQNFLISMLLLSLLIITIYTTYLRPSHHSLGILSVYVIAILCVGYIQVKFQKYYSGALAQIRNSLDSTLFEFQPAVIPVHTSPLIAAFEYTFNQLGFSLHKQRSMSKRLAEYNAELQQNARYQRLISLGELASNIAHEINTPLGAVTIDIQRIQRAIAKGGEIDREKFTPLCERSLQTINKISEIIEAMKSLSRGDDVNSPKSVFSLSSTIRQALGISRKKLSDYGIDLRVNDETSVNDLVEGHPVQIFQVLINLINNAFDALEDHRDSRWIQITLKRDRDLIRLCVTDSGTGIRNEEVKAKMFDSYYTTKPVDKGTGLGLPLCKKIIQSHGGTIYYNQDAPNTTFCIELPATSSVQLANPA